MNWLPALLVCLLFLGNQFIIERLTGTTVAASKAVLQSSDFTFDGVFRYPETVGALNATDAAYGFTLRTVGGTTRFLANAFGTGNEPQQRLWEGCIPGTLRATAPYNDSTVPEAQISRIYGDVYRRSNGTSPIDLGTAEDIVYVHGIHWDETTTKFIWAAGPSYWTSGGPTDGRIHIGKSTLSDGANANCGDSASRSGTADGAWGLSGRSWKYTLQGFVEIPSAWRTHVNGYRLAGVGGGSWSSGITASSNGPTITAFDVAFGGQPDQSLVNDYTIVAGYPTEAESGESWYYLGFSEPQTSNHAERDTNYCFDTGVAKTGTQAYSNADCTTSTTGNNASGESWQPHNGKGYWNWLQIMATALGAAWIDLPTKHGVVFPTIQGDGRGSYSGATETDKSSHWMFVMNPDDLKLVANGTKQQWQIQPAARWSFQLPGVSYPLLETSPTNQAIDYKLIGTHYDATNQKLYIAREHTGTGGSPTVWVWRYSVN